MVKTCFRRKAVQHSRRKFASRKRSPDHKYIKEMKMSILRSPINGHLQAKKSNLQEVKQETECLTEEQNVTTQELKELFGDAFGKMKVSRECEERLFNQENDFNHGN